MLAAERRRPRSGLLLRVVDCTRLLILLRQAGDVHAEDLLALVVHQLLTGLGEVLGDVLRRWLLLIEYAQDDTGPACIDRPGDRTLGQSEGNRARPAHGAEIGNLSVLTHEVAGLKRDVHLRRSLL